MRGPSERRQSGAFRCISTVLNLDTSCVLRDTEQGPQKGIGNVKSRWFQAQRWLDSVFSTQTPQSCVCTVCVLYEILINWQMNVGTWQNVFPVDFLGLPAGRCLRRENVKLRLLKNKHVGVAFFCTL